MRLLRRLTRQARATTAQVPEESGPSRPTFAALTSRSPEHRRRLVELVRDMNAAGGTYHQLDFGDGLVMQGDYDMNRYVQHYHLPDSLEGQTVLDIGAAAGYFTLECARRGGAVTAIDIYDKPLLSVLIPLLNVGIRYVRKSVYELDEGFGLFDLVLCGSVLLHLPDPFGAVQRMRSVCRRRAIVATSCPKDSASNAQPVCEFVGQKSAHGDYWHYWNIGARALRNMFLAARFSEVAHEEHFVLASEPGRAQFSTPHVVMTAAA